MKKDALRLPRRIRPRGRPHWRYAAILLIALQGCTLSMDERGVINRYLTCDDCVDEALPDVVSMGWRAMPRLEGALIGPDTSRATVVRENARREFQLIPGPEMDDVNFVDAAVLAYTSTYQARAAIALREIGDRSIRPGCFYRQLWPPRTCREQAQEALLEAQSADSLYAPVVQALIDDQVSALPGGTSGSTYLLRVAVVITIGVLTFLYFKSG